jgi:hypothetical protein
MYLGKAVSKVCIRYNLSGPFPNDMPLLAIGLELKIGRVQGDHEANGDTNVWFGLPSAYQVNTQTAKQSDQTLGDVRRALI